MYDLSGNLYIVDLEETSTGYDVTVNTSIDMSLFVTFSGASKKDVDSWALEYYYKVYEFSENISVSLSVMVKLSIEIIEDRRNFKVLDISILNPEELELVPDRR